MAERVRAAKAMEESDAALARSLAAEVDCFNGFSASAQSGEYLFDNSSKLADLQNEAKRLNVNAGVGGRSGGTKSDLVERVNRPHDYGRDDDFSFIQRRPPSPPPARQGGGGGGYE